MDFAQKYSFWIIAVLIIAGVFGILVVSTDTTTNTNTDTNTATTSSTDNIAQETTITEATLYLSKAPNEKITVVEYSDFQCPACANVFGLLNQAKTEFADEVSFEFRHFPLTTIHPNAMTAHRIAQAAANQDKFIFVHDLLFTNTTAWTSASNPSEAIYNLIRTSSNDINLDVLQADVSKSETLAAINADVSSGKQLGVQGTPSLFINGIQIQLVNYESLQTAIQSELDKN